MMMTNERKIWEAALLLVRRHGAAAAEIAAARGAAAAPRRRRTDLRRVVLDRPLDGGIAPPGPRQGRAGALSSPCEPPLHEASPLRYPVACYSTVRRGMSWQRVCWAASAAERHASGEGVRGRAERGGVAAQAVTRAISGVARARHRTRRVEPARQGVRRGHLPLRRLRPAAVRLRHQIQQRHRLAEFLGAGRAGGRDADRPQLFHDPHRGALQPLRRPSRPRLRRWPAADRAALLYERRVARLSSRREAPRPAREDDPAPTS